MEVIVTWASEYLSLKHHEEKITFDTFLELEDYAISVGHALVIDFKEKTIIVYDDYLE